MLVLKIKFEVIIVVNMLVIFVVIFLVLVYFSFSCIINDFFGYNIDYLNFNILKGRYCCCFKKLIFS